MEHYQCHIINIKKTKSKRIPDIVYFKHKHITRPTLTPVYTVVKAIDDLTKCALKGARNTQEGMQQIERLKTIDELLNKIPSNLAEILDPPSTTHMKTPIPRVEDIRPRPSPLSFQSPPPPNRDTPETTLEQAPRVQNEEENLSIKDTTKSIKHQFRQNMQYTATQRTRIPQHHQMQLQMQYQREQAHLIRDKEKGEYQKYHQLIRDPKHKETWSQSAANEFGRLAQCVGGRLKGTNTICLFTRTKSHMPG